MKKLFFIIIVFFQNNICLSQTYQEFKYKFEDSKEAFYVALDSLHAVDSTHTFSFRLDIAEKGYSPILKYVQDNWSTNIIVLNIPPFIDENEGQCLLDFADSLAQTNSYKNKLMAYRICKVTVDFAARRLKKDQKCVVDWQGRLIRRASTIDMDHCYRFLWETPVISFMPKCLYDNELKQKAKLQFNSLYISNSEAKIYAQKDWIRHSLKDTIGYAYYSAKEDSLKDDDWNNYVSMRSLLKRAKEKNQSFQEYCDSLNANVFKQRVKDYTGLSLNLFSIIQSFDRKCMYEMAPFIDSIYHAKIFPKQENELLLILAKMGYKNYQPIQLAHYGAKIDSILSQIPQINDKEKLIDIKRSFYKYAENLKSIGTQEAYNRMAAGLLVAKGMPEYDREYLITFNATFFIWLKENISNFPIDEKPVYEKIMPRYFKSAKERNVTLPAEYYTPEWYINGLGDWEIDKYFDKDFCDRMYQWMIKNKGKYNIVSRNCEEW